MKFGKPDRWTLFGLIIVTVLLVFNYTTEKSGIRTCEAYNQAIDDLYKTGNKGMLEIPEELKPLFPYAINITIQNKTK